MEVAPGKLKDTTDRTITRNYVFRGRVATLDGQGSLHLCFDSEHMRVAGAWHGKLLWDKAGKDMGPVIAGSMIFATRPGPGWARDGEWKDPRPGLEGPLPRTWAHYRGLYVHGSRVVFDYEVGGVRVLEMPGGMGTDAHPSITRTFKVAPSPRENILLVCEEPGSKNELVSRRPNRSGANDRLVFLEKGVECLRIACDGAPAKSTWEVKEGRVHLRLPPSTKPVHFRLTLVRLPRDDRDLDSPLPPLEDPEDFVRGGPALWKETILTHGEPAKEKAQPYVVDRIGLPEKNPWKASVRFGGLDFFPDGRAALSTWDGDVWIVSGLDQGLEKVVWRRFAAGLQQPLGLKIVDGIIHTAGRDQITRLHDLNRDGMADHYENFHNVAGLTLQRHEFVMDLQTDREGNFYYGRSGHYVASAQGHNCCVWKVAPDGRRAEVFARGFREPNGLGIGPDGTLTVGDNEGNGVPQTPIYRLRAGVHYGYTPAPKGKGGSWKLQEKPILWLPKEVDRSAGGQVWGNGNRWGPLSGQLLHTSYGHCALFAVLIDRSMETWQGTAWKFPLAFDSGIMRARFHPGDGQLYLCGLRGWSTNAARDGQFCRVRFTGNKAPVPVAVKVTPKGLKITFSGPLDRAWAEDDGNWAGDWVESLSTGGKKKEAREELPIQAVHLEADGKTVRIGLRQVKPVSNWSLQYRLRSAGGDRLSGHLYGTIHQVPATE